MVEALEQLSAAGVNHPTALTLGVFDGLHLGHRSLLNAVRRVARHFNLASAVCFFKNHPSTVLNPSGEFDYLTTWEERARTLRFSGIDHPIPLTFDQELAALPPEAFVAELVERVHLKQLVVEPDFALGKGRAGTVPVLTALGVKYGFEVRPQEPYRLDGDVVSSSVIRQCLRGGDVSGAEQMLGHPYRLRGLVVKGDQRGRTLGFPTANVAVPPHILVPANGIYTTYAHLTGEVDLGRRRGLLSVTSIGTRPTFSGIDRRVETFLLDLDRDIYGEDLAIDLMEFQRPELRFESVDALIAQMHVDVAHARSVFAPQPR